MDMPFSGHPDNPTEHHRGDFDKPDENPYWRSDASAQQEEPTKTEEKPAEPQEEKPKESEKKEIGSLDESRWIMSSVILKIIEIEKELDLSRETLSMLKDFSIE